MARSRSQLTHLRSLLRRLSARARAIACRIHPVTLVIWVLTCTPLYDDIFFATAANGQLALTSRDGIWRSFVFAIACFCGGGAVATALTLSGEPQERLSTLFGVYLTIALGLLNETGMMWSPWHLPTIVLLSLAAGLLVTLLTALFASWLTRWLDPIWITRSGTGSIATIACNEMGVPMPLELTTAILFGGLVLPLILTSRHVRRLRCRPRARRIRRYRMTTPRITPLKVT